MTKKEVKAEKSSEKKVEKVKAEEVGKSDEPSWYHYLIVLAVMVGLFAGVYYGYYFFTGDDVPTDYENTTAVSYVYKYKVGNFTYNIHFENDISEVAASSYVVEPSLMDIVNTKSFRMGFYEYNSSDNGEILVASTKLRSFLRFVYKYDFGLESFAMINETNCSVSTLRDKVIVFDPYSDKVGVFYNETNGCIEFMNDGSADGIVDMVDKLIYNVIEEDGGFEK